MSARSEPFVRSPSQQQRAFLRTHSSEVVQKAVTINTTSRINDHGRCSCCSRPAGSSRRGSTRVSDARKRDSCSLGRRRCGGSCRRVRWHINPLRSCCCGSAHLDEKEKEGSMRARA